MLLWNSARLAAATFAAALCLPALGQFQEPTKEELQMTVDAKAPGANAVYLIYAEDRDDSNLTTVYYERIKILTEKGKEAATVRFTHDPDTKFEVEGRTVHGDGTVIPLTDKPNDLVEFKTKDSQTNSLVFTLPDAEVGSILEFRIKFKGPSLGPLPTWIIQQDYFVHKAHFSYKAGLRALWGLTLASRLPAGDRVTSDKGLYVLDLTDIAVLPQDDWMPPLNTFKYRVSFFVSRFDTKEKYWEASEKNWADFVLAFTNPTSKLKKAAAEMLTPGDTDAVKAQKIYAAVMKLENTDFTREKTKRERKKEKIKDIHNAQDVWRDQSGNGDEIALLYVALCRAAGLNVVPMMVVDRSRAIFDEGLLNFGQMEDFIAVAQLDGKEMFLDPGQKMCPFGSLHWKHSFASGFRLMDKTAKLAMTPSLSFKASNVIRSADLIMDSAETVGGSVRLVFQGQDALYWRQIALENDEEEVKKRFTEWMNGYLPEGVQAEFDHFLGLADYEANLIANVRVSGNLGTVTGKHFFLPALFFEVKTKHPFVAQDKRTIPVDVHYAKVEQDEVIYHLPSGYTADESPRPITVLWPDHAQLTIATTSEAASVRVVRTLTYSYTILNPTEYGSLHDFYQKVATADQQQITLTKSGANATGN